MVSSRSSAPWPAPSSAPATVSTADESGTEPAMHARTHGRHFGSCRPEWSAPFGSLTRDRLVDAGAVLVALMLYLFV